MVSDFLTGLANQIGDQFGLGENQNRSLDVSQDGTSQRYGKLGDFSKTFDQSQERRYLQEGYLRTDQYNASPKQLEILFQEPDITVLVKKRAFNSLAENFQMDHMDSDEKLFYKATKILFANKCKQIGAYERLCRIQRVSAETGQLAAQLIPLVISLTDELSSSVSDITSEEGNTILTGTDPTGGGLTKLQSTIDKIKKIYSFGSNAAYTTWLVDSSNFFKSQYGQGTGVIEFCNVTNVNTTSSINFEGGSFSLNISDPYNMMVVTEYDIERALSDATNSVYNHKIFQFGQDSIDSLVDLNTKRLNDLRAQRGATPIQFLTNPDTLLSKRVRALISGPGIEINFDYNPAAGLSGIAPGLGGVTISPEFFRGGLDVLEEGLDTKSTAQIDPVTGETLHVVTPNSESSLFSTVIENIFTSLQLQRNSVSTTQQNSAITNYSRKKLMDHYCGKSVVQPQDQIHVYISSKTRLDNKILGGMQNMFTGLGFLQKLNNTSADFKNQFDSLFNPNGNANFQLEKNLYVGADFPNWLWTIMRNVFVTETAGVSVFGGVVTGADSSFRNGVYSIDVSGRDMTHYLKQGRVNFKPAVDVFNGPLYDPLTPFKTSYNTVSNNFKSNEFELLDENKKILASKSVRFKSGALAGQVASEKNLMQQDNEPQNLGQIRQVFYSPDGLVYKWKEGIGTLTQLSNSVVIDGDNTLGAPALTKDPFAGQDVMNAISLSITGQPYNYATFYKAASEVDSFGRDPQTGADSAFSYYKSLTRDLVKNNLLWGNFIPFKNLYVDESTYANMIKSQLTVLNANDKIDQQLRDVQTTTNQLQLVLGVNLSDPSNNDLKNKLQAQLQTQQALLQDQYTQINNQLQNNQGSQGLSIIGNDVSFDFDPILNTDQGNNSGLSQPNIRKELRRKINFLTRRLSWQVRANEDKNYLIVDDSYDKDYDIQAFEKALGDMQLFNSEFTSVFEKIKAAAQLLNLEVFCDTQGHIRVRPPLYNRMPSSVFYKLFQLKQQSGIQIFPQFLEDLFVNQLKSLQENLEIIEDQIRLDGALLGKATDFDCQLIIKGILGGSQSSVSVGNGSFSFLTDEKTGNLSDFSALYSESNPEAKIELIDNTIEGQLKTQLNINSAFTAVQKSQFIIEQTVSPLLNGQTVTTQIAQQRLSLIVSRLQVKSGQQVNIDQFKSTNSALSTTNVGSKVPDVFKISNDISANLVKRQQLVKQLSKALKNAKESISLDSTTGDQTSNRLLMPNISPNSQIPDVFENMIEDESYDDLGPGSGKRYVIEEHNILSYTIREVIPEYTMVEVKGQLDLFLPNSELPSDLNNFNGGNALVSAAAVDYDMWRMYGFINSSSVAAPFLSNPESQCAPYAASILSRARKDILRGNLSIVGNEYMQPGDTIYLRSKNLLFYVSQVTHSFAYGSTFQTNLELTYGHSPGSYIPTTLDVIGKLLYNNRDSTSYTNYRQSNSFNQQSVGVIILDKRGGTDTETLLLDGSYGEQNAKVINDILYTTYLAVQSNKVPSSTVKPSIELRIYYDGENGFPIDNTVLEAAGIVKDMLTGHFQYQSKSPIGQTSKTLDDSDVVDPTTSAVDVSAKVEFRSPSQKAIDMVRNINGSASSNGNDGNDQINTTLFGYIIDVWINFTNESSE